MSSKIKVDTIENVAGSGNVSLGSGHNLVVPGNITGQGTTTLTGDLTVDTSTLVAVASNNRVGIGTNSPQRQVMISRSIADGSGELGIVSSDSSTSGALGNIHFGNSTDSSLASIRATADGATDAGKLEFNTEKTGAAIETAMRIDSNGRVTKPLHPSFSVRSNAGNNGNTWEQGQDIKFQLVDRNNGSHYATGTGRFTAPVAGFYHFNYNGFGYSAGRVPAAGTASVQIRKNGTAVIAGAYVEVNTSTGYPNCGFSFSLLLAASDYVTIRAQSQGQYADASGLYTSFSGFLVG